jgi:hypothetical protein
MPKYRFKDMLREPNEIQLELFDEFITPELKSKQRLHRRIIRKRVPPQFRFTLSYENVIISIICLILVIIVSFSLGIERGKRLVDLHVSPSTDTTAVEVKEQNFKKKELSPYIIQVATFKQKVLAEKEVARLRKLNYNSFFSNFGKFHQVFVGGYSTKELARQDLKKLRKIYKDCFIKKLAVK